jgi:low affinity Fe/Cu permease
MNKWFTKFANAVSEWAGSQTAFLLAILVVGIWIGYAVPHRFDSNSQMPINTFTTVATFLMVFLIQHTQNRNEKIQDIKNNELLRAFKDARNDLIHLDEKPDEELDRIEEDFKKVV